MSAVTVALEKKLQSILENQYDDLEYKILEKLDSAKTSEVVNVISYQVNVAFRKLLTLAQNLVIEYRGILDAKKCSIFESNHEYRKSIK